MKKDYIPHEDAELDTWEDNFLAQVDAVATGLLAIPAADVTVVKNQITTHRGTYSTAVTAKAAAKTATSDNKTAKGLAVLAGRGLAQRIKKTPGYTEGMGNTLKIIGPEDTFDLLTAKPLLKLTFTGDHVQIDFNKPAQVTGVKIYCWRSFDPQYRFLAIDTESPYIDNRPNINGEQPETRKYKAWFYHDDEVVGLESEEYSILVNILPTVPV